MPENDPAAQAKAIYEGLVAEKAEYLPGEVSIILDIAKMSDSDIAGAVKQAHKVKRMAEKEIEAIFYQSEVGQEVVKKMAEVARSKAE